jgi:type II secretory pathway pseudopilin PulG
MCVGRQPRTAVRGRFSAFTLVEALVAIAMTAIAGSVLLLGTASSLQTSEDALQRTIANGMAQQLMDEALGGRYMEFGGSPYDAVPAPGGAELSGGGRRLYDDVGDFNGFRGQPPTDLYGVALGTDNGQGGQRPAAFQCPAGFFQNWRQEIDVYYVDGGNPAVRLAPGRTSDYRAVEVRVVYNDPSRGARELARIRRVVAYVPPPQVN